MNDRASPGADYHLADDHFDKLLESVLLTGLGRNFPPKRPLFPPSKPAAKFYLPPGKSTNVSLWTVEDVRLWVGKFLKPSEHAETFQALEEHKIDGACLKSIYKNKPAHTAFGINLNDFEAIQAHAHKIFNIKIVVANNLWDEPAKEYFLPNNIHFRLAKPDPAPVDDAAPEAAGPLKRNIKSKPVDPDSPPNKRPTPTPKPDAQFYLPRVKATDKSLWTNQQNADFASFCIQKKLKIAGPRYIGHKITGWTVQMLLFL
ncbi:hypothetical protein B9Z55_023624 [Caenorhabditis nigoni]|uniref:SAM domain-containing protein n=1 Tax=Caenorhabditis nigoni TaxID=1611254 RepID=A0A2G5SQH8_9PELO|nr:hypothetical protein B9Z55_023624 [Caenorhabditis nigoni]